MIIDRNVARYVVFAEDPILNALRKISENKSGAVFSVTESGESRRLGRRSWYT